MNGFCLKQDQGLKGLDGQYTHTPNFSAVISSLPSPPHVSAFRPSPGQRKARNLIMPYFSQPDSQTSEVVPDPYAFPSPPTRAIFRAVFDSSSSFFAPKQHGNACYAGFLVLRATRLGKPRPQSITPPQHCSKAIQPWGRGASVPLTHDSQRSKPSKKCKMAARDSDDSVDFTRVVTCYVRGPLIPIFLPLF